MGEAIDPEGSVREPDAVAAIVRRGVAEIEKIIRAHPDQWYCFYPFWDDPSRKK